MRCNPCQEAYKASPEYKEKIRARSAVSIAIAAGTLKRQPCEHLYYWNEKRCGSPAHAHHEDYSRPLDVVWLCPGHHHQRHFQLKQTPVPPLLVVDRPGQPIPDRDW